MSGVRSSSISRTHNTESHHKGVLEWTIAFGFTFYLLTFFYDLRMSKGVRKGELTAAYADHELSSRTRNTRHV